MSPLQQKGRVTVHLGSILHEYTDGASEIMASGRTLRAVLTDLERTYPGLRFRIIDEQDSIRPHIKIYVSGLMARGLNTTVAEGGEVFILQALSGG